jgi:hypothetical protein
MTALSKFDLDRPVRLLGVRAEFAGGAGGSTASEASVVRTPDRG